MPQTRRRARLAPGAGLVVLALALGACAPQGPHLAAPAIRPEPWALESDLKPDPAWHFSTLANGMRVAIRHNATPAGQVQVRLRIHAGSLDETDAERGYAHFVEHMAFEGSTHVAPGEMVKLLERGGLAFGADTNAFTSYDTTIYALDLPKNDASLVDTALMLMRESASELSFPADAVSRQRGVVLSEKRDRDNYQYREMVDRIAFNDPDARYTQRMPIGTPQALNAATPETLRAFWRRNYVPAKATLIIVGDVDASALDAAIHKHFDDWTPAPSPPQPSPGPVRLHDSSRIDIYLDPALSERVIVSAHGPYQPEPDSAESRRQHLLRSIGYGIINRRLARLARQADLPYRDAGFGTGDTFKVGRATNLVIDAVDGQWAKSLTTAALEYRRALEQGFTPAEVAEQLANTRTAAEHAAAAADTQASGALLQHGLAAASDDIVPTSPADNLARLNAFAPTITPDMVLAALKFEAVPLSRPLIRYHGRRAPKGGAEALRAVWQTAMKAPLPPAKAAIATTFAYTDFGPPGTIASDITEPMLGIREIRFANGVRLNLKHTDLAHDQVLVSLAIDGGEMLDTKDQPLATEMTGVLSGGGLGKHSQDDLQSLLAGHQVSANLAATPESFDTGARTTPADLALELQLLTALITDPGYRREGEVQYRLSINNAFAQMRATPGGAMNADLGGILSDNDPRFTVQKIEAYRALTFDKLKAVISDRLAYGAIEVGIVGDIDEAAAIAAVAKTLGALPAREGDFRPYTDQRARPFTANHTARIITHTGPADQALVRYVWPTRDDSDAHDKQVLNMLSRIAQLQITDNLREKLGKTYSPGVGSDPSRVWRGYGTFTVTASVNVDDVAKVRAAIDATIAALRAAPISADTMLRARAPMIEGFENALKSNGGWLGLVGRAQTQSDRIERHIHAIERLNAITAQDVQAAARTYLTDAGAVVITALPASGPAPAKPAS